MEHYIEIKDIVGQYNIDNIDGVKQNLHFFKHLKLNLRFEHDSIKLVFISCEKFEYRNVWKRGDIYAYTDRINSYKSFKYPISLKVYESRPDGKIRVDNHYKLLIEKNSFQIMLVDCGEILRIDHFKKVDSKEPVRAEENI